MSEPDKGLREEVARQVGNALSVPAVIGAKTGEDVQRLRESVTQAILALPVLSREGWRWVPEEPTREMKLAGWVADGGDADDPDAERLLREYELIYRAMLSVSPLPSGVGSVSQDSQATCAPHGAPSSPVRAPGAEEPR